MLTTYGYGRLSLPAPTITLNGTGSIAGANATYYFWVVARNRVGFNNPSTVRSLVIPNSSKITVGSASFAINNYEAWREMYIAVSKTNDYTTARIIYRQNLYNSDNITLATLSNFDISTDASLNGATSVALPANLPTGVPNGYRCLVNLNSKVYEFVSGGTDTVDGVAILSGTGGIWKLVPSNSLIETSVTCNKELYQVTQQELYASSLASSFSNSVPITFYIINNSGAGLTAGELILNAYISDPSIKYKFNVTVLGYLNLSTYSLDTTGITYVNTVISYPDVKIQLAKTLPDNTAFVVRVTPNILSASDVVLGTYLSLYPKIVDYTTISDIKAYDEPVADIAALRALPASVLKAGQVRLVRTTASLYLFDETSTAVDNGSTILKPNYNPTTGRWLVIQSTIQDGSITQSKLGSDVLALFSSGIKTTYINISTSTTQTIDLSAVPSYDYYIIDTPLNDGGTTTLNFTGTTMANTSVLACLIELRQKTGAVVFDNSLLFPGGTIPSLSGNGKSDLIAIILTKDNTGTLKKRAMVLQKNLG